MTAVGQIAAPPYGLEVAVTPDRGVVWVQAAGELDLATAATLRDAVVDLVTVGFDHLIIDLRALSFIDVSGIRLLLTLNDQASRDGWQLGLAHGEGQVKRILALSGAMDQLASHQQP